MRDSAESSNTFQVSVQSTAAKKEEERQGGADVGIEGSKVSNPCPTFRHFPMKIIDSGDTRPSRTSRGSGQGLRGGSEDGDKDDEGTEEVG